jgi:putative two-component system response regulator
MTSKQHRVLLVDDEPVVRKILRQRLSAEGYHCEEAGNVEEALGKLAKDGIELVVLDIKMPGKSGAEFLPEIKHMHPDTAVIMATANTDTATAINCMKEGAYDYVIKPFNLDEVAISAQRALEKRGLELENRAYQQHLEEMVAERTVELKQAIGKIKLASLDTIHRLARAAEYKDEDTGTHIQRISQYSAAIADKMGLGQSEVENILYASPMHDVGKIGIPDHILLKTGSLDADEWEIMKKHTVMGAEILQGSDAEFIQLAGVVALTHHEKWDGSGYPRGLRGSEIPLAGRIVAIADVFDALTSKRPYKNAYSIEESLKIIREKSDTHFDPDVVDAFFAVKHEILAIRQKYADAEESKSYIKNRGSTLHLTCVSPIQEVKGMQRKTLEREISSG